MAIKRIIPPGKQIVKEVEKEETWTEFLLGGFARYWYILGCLAADVFSTLEILRHDEWDFRFSMAAILLIVLLVIEIWGYFRLWGRDGIWNFDDEYE